MGRPGPACLPTPPHCSHPPTPTQTTPTTGFTLLTVVRSASNLLSALRASRVIHHRSLTALVRAPVTFFDTTPVGRILNRFSKVGWAGLGGWVVAA